MFTKTTTISDHYSVLGTLDNTTGAWIPSDYSERCDEFVAETGMVDWRNREAEAEAREAGMLLDSRDFPVAPVEGAHAVTVADWEAFHAIGAEYV